MSKAAAKRVVKSVKLGGPSHLSRVLAKLNTEPRLTLKSEVKSLSVSWAPKQWAIPKAFVKEYLPRIRWANPELEIKCERLFGPDAKEKAALKVEFADGTIKDFPFGIGCTEKFMDEAGASTWAKYKAQRIAAGLPVISDRPDTEQAVESALFAKMGIDSPFSNTIEGKRAKDIVPEDVLIRRLTSVSA